MDRPLPNRENRAGLVRSVPSFPFKPESTSANLQTIIAQSAQFRRVMACLRLPQWCRSLRPGDRSGLPGNGRERCNPTTRSSSHRNPGRSPAVALATKTPTYPNLLSSPLAAGMFAAPPGSPDRVGSQQPTALARPYRRRRIRRPPVDIPCS